MKQKINCNKNHIEKWLFKKTNPKKSLSIPKNHRVKHKEEATRIYQWRRFFEESIMAKKQSKEDEKKKRK